jgi:hypothetical protein
VILFPRGYIARQQVEQAAATQRAMQHFMEAVFEESADGVQERMVERPTIQ